jgi:CubicO group peptidase (beta-lactamase class C family)
VKPLALGIALLVTATPLAAQEAALRDHPRVRESLALLAAWADAKRAYEGIPGVSMAVVHDQELIWSQGLGLANREADVPATPQTIYSICSISKLFTSIAVMQLRDAGKLRLDDPVSRHLRWYALRDTFPADAPVTIEGILTHSSGLPRESDFPYWSPPDFAFPTREQVIERQRQQVDLYPAWTYSQYSNLGLVLAGEVVASVSHQKFDKYVQTRILEPLAMRSTTPEIPVALHGTRLAVGYSSRLRDGTRPALPVFEGRGIAPAMAFASTVEDLARFASWQFRVLEHGAKDVLDRNTLREMYRVHWVDPGWKTTWGLGFEVNRVENKTYVGHGGSCPGYRSHITIDPESQMSGIFMSNAGGVDAGLFARRAVEIVGAAVEEALDPENKPRVADPTLAPFVGTYDEAPWGGETAVVFWKGGLAAVSLPEDDPMSELVELRRTGPHTFRRVRRDKKLGEEVRFDVGADGRVTRMWWHSNYSIRR